MYIIVGLGNPGRDYVGTRHNVGFEVIDVIANKYDINLNKEKFRAVYGEGRIAGEKVMLVKPQTFMNLSGESVREIMDWYKVDPEQLIVIYDDISLEVGTLRIRPKGSAGGHNGMKNIIYQLNTDMFPRVKVGIGAPKHEEHALVDYVLGKFSKEEVDILVKTAVKAADAVEVMIKDTVELAMSRFNGKTN